MGAVSWAAENPAPAVRKITRASLSSAVRSIWVHSAVICSARHPVLRVQEHIAMERARRLLGEEIGHRGVMHLDPVERAI